MQDDATRSTSAGASRSSTRSTQAPSTAAATTEQAQDAAHEVAQQVRDQASTRLSDQIGRASDTLGSVSGAMRSMSGQMRDQDQAFVAQYTDRLAEQVDRASQYLRNKDLDELVSDAERFVRSQPAVAVGGAFALGLLAARFLKSSGRSMPSGSTYGQSQGSYGASAAPGDYSAPSQALPAMSGVTGAASPPY